MRQTGKMLLLMVFLSAGTAQAQEEMVRKEIQTNRKEGGTHLNIGADLVSRYVWRGYDYGNSPAIQPNLNFSWEGLALGAWGSYAFTDHSVQVNDSLTEHLGNYSEIDLYLSYTYRWFSIMVYDIFTMNGLNPNKDNLYFDWNNQTTGHTLEAILSFNGTEKVPLQVLASLFFYGDDKTKGENGLYGTGDKNNFSTYFELAYTFDISTIGVELEPFIGGTPSGGSWYGPYGGIINVGLFARKDIRITQSYSLPVEIALITNPQSQSAFLVFGITL